MCKSNSPKRICGKDVSAYIARRDAGVKYPKIFFCHDIRGAVLMALLDRADKTPSGPPDDKPDFDRQILKIGVHYWPLIAKCNMKHQGDAYDSLIIPAFREHVKWVLRKAVIHGALVSTSEGWKRAPGTRFIDEKEAGEWLQMKLDGVNNNSMAVTQPKIPAQSASDQTTIPVHSVAAARPDTLASSRWANKATMPDMNRLSLNETRAPMFLTTNRDSRNSQDKPSALPAVSRTVEEWRNKVSAESLPRLGRAELKDRLERIGRERQEQLDRLKKAADEEGVLWAQI
ncbi:hypothetical protein CDV31_017149 [Fusarium ambrosium]|uniref:Uncharacterized protein n=1 Tax=Fusarium ambrosium TaxID=131363 RepID=A0A428RRC5_9HYPO|nr:hypothetical protein CDV31_017149 [Fusarium ambrosium]